MDPSLRLPSEINTITALHLFSAVQVELDRSPSYLQGLDDLLEKIGGLRRGDVLEVQGLAGTGKTSLLLQITLINLLQSSIYHAETGKTIHIGGKQSQICFIDCYHRFPFARLVTLLRILLVERIRPIQNPPKAELVNQLIDECLQRFTLFQPKTMLELAATIKRLTSFYTSSTDGNWSPTSTESLAAILIDDMSIYGWSSQYSLEQSITKPISSSALLSHLVSAIATTRRTLGCNFWITQWVFNPNSIPSYSGNDEKKRLPFYNSHLESPWPKLTTISNHSDRLEPIIQPVIQPPRPGFVIHHHLTLHKKYKHKLVKKGSNFEDVWKNRNEARKMEDSVNEFVAVLRSAGKEVGSWEWSIDGDGIVC